jgi:hypothetical protein
VSTQFQTSRKIFTTNARVQWKSIERLIQQHVQHGRRFLDAQSSRDNCLPIPIYFFWNCGPTHGVLQCTEIQRWRNLAAVHDTGFSRTVWSGNPFSTYCIVFQFLLGRAVFVREGVRTNQYPRRWTICSLPPNPIYGVYWSRVT